ncbi:MAG: oxygenase MpaB family protein [Acidobacteriota bacterium]|nr:oxygenase MpaB family protein [Acidobacteriota bacterium]
MQMPSCYSTRYEKARALDPKRASNYIAHTMIGDPEADAVIEQLAPLGQEKAMQFFRAALDKRDASVLQEAPPLVRDFFERMESPPDWLDLSALTPACRMFHRNSRLVLGAFVGGVLVEGFSTNISKSFFITGRVRDQGIRRLKQNNRHLIEIFMPGGLEKDGDGWKLSVRIRMVHAQIRRLLKHSEDWDTDSWGVPLSAAHLGFAITAFSARLLRHMKNLGAEYNDDERKSFMKVWRYSGYLMGIPETILFRDEADALRLFEIGLMCEPPPELESIVMANSLINSSPLIIGVENPAVRRTLAKQVFNISRALIGDTLADGLMYPAGSTLGVLPWHRLQERCHRLVEKILPGRAQNNNFTRFTSLLEASMFDEAGISFRLPDHVHAEESSKW